MKAESLASEAAMGGSGGRAGGRAEVIKSTPSILRKCPNKAL